MNNLGDAHQDEHRAGARTKAATDIGDSKAVTNHGDSHQDGHREGVKTKAETNSGDSKEEPWPDLYGDHGGPTQDDLQGLDIIDSLTRYPEKAITKGKGPGNYRVNSEDIQVMRVFIANLTPTSTTAQ